MPARATRLRREVGGVALLLLALFLLGAIVVERAGSVAACGGADAGVFGPAGSCFRGFVVGLLGLSAALLLPLIPGVHGLRLLGRVDERPDRKWLVCLAGGSLILPITIALVRGPVPRADAWAGLWGNGVAFSLLPMIGPGGAWLVVLLAVSALTVWTLLWNPVRVVVGGGNARRPAGVALSAAAREALALEPAPEEMPALDLRLMDDAPLPAALALVADEDDAEASRAETPKERRKREKAKKADAVAAREEQVAAAIEATAEVPDVAGQALPGAELLAQPEVRNQDANRRELDAAGAKLMEALRTFKVEGALVGRTTGPTVTQFEIEPAAGVKVRQFANLANDLALAMRAPSIRIVAPIPGRGAVGVEVPNPNPEMVRFRELIESRDFRDARAALPIALGKDLEGKTVVADLAKMPHLLIAGATGAGKSVCVNTIITSLVYRHTPQTLRFLMVDPKMVELSVYNELPHLRHKVITDNRDAAAVLKWAVMEMQDRYALLAANGCRNLQDFNVRVQKGAPLKKPKDPNVAFEHSAYEGGVLPYIVVIIDEMADLMMTVQGEVETPIAMLAQKARAIGIHLILATQRPSVNVITGLIKANFPSRIAFRVASQVDSRTIIDGAGAEMLLGNGDMLFIPPGKSEPSRLQGAYLSSEETEKLMGWFAGQREAKREELAAQGLILEEASQAEPDILETVRAREALEASGDGEGGGDDAGDRDKLFREAAEVVIQHQQGSTSLLQRRMNVGYGRAARIIDQLHSAGVLGPPNGSKPRDVLVGLEDLERIAPK